MTKRRANPTSFTPERARAVALAREAKRRAERERVHRDTEAAEREAQAREHDWVNWLSAEDCASLVEAGLLPAEKPVRLDTRARTAPQEREVEPDGGTPTVGGDQASEPSAVPEATQDRTAGAAEAMRPTSQSTYATFRVSTMNEEERNAA